MLTKENLNAEDILETVEPKNKNKFSKISKKQFSLDMQNICEYSDIKLPQRATKNSAGYDFYSICDFVLTPGQTIKLPTGIKVSLNDFNFLMCVPRSSLGFKYRLQLDNTVGIIDADYINSDNEGHIWVKMTNMSNDKTLYIKKGEAIFQGIILNFSVTNNDKADKERNGGFGSTNT